MNRQIRRDQERREQKAEKEKAKRRRERRRSRGNRSSPSKSDGDGKSGGGGGGGGGKPKRAPGRFSGFLMGATVVFILLQGIITPEAELGLVDRIAAAGFYGLFSYFTTLWLYRTGRSNAAGISTFAGGMLALGVEIGKLAQGGYQVDLLVLGLILLFLPLGALLGRLVWNRSPR